MQITADISTGQFFAQHGAGAIVLLRGATSPVKLTGHRDGQLRCFDERRNETVGCWVSDIAKVIS